MSLFSRARYLASNSLITEADVRLFVTLIRFDEVYVVYFKVWADSNPSRNMHVQFSNLFIYLFISSISAIKSLFESIQVFKII